MIIFAFTLGIIVGLWIAFVSIKIIKYIKNREDNND